MVLYSFTRYIILVILFSAAILAMQPYQISADIEARKLVADFARRTSPKPPTPTANTQKHVHH
ncbi:hypothetical protein I3843_15G115700 [Carya illinoinensis]|uniref:Uncharacterized protein n=1 Tax=Carya illinoinensis TaxID=32201 RepID=A0A922A651_CARIL|nr:hypothetical protein I3842_15G120900 [Carya illinoinensis]KAG7944689.1 hypothetical protein I3843_15G115700 [Carya illinoinensis]